jgi:hypothetical protein
MHRLHGLAYGLNGNLGLQIVDILLNDATNVIDV